MNESFFVSWAVTATIAAVYYAIREAKMTRQRFWAVKMLLKVHQRQAQVTREGNKITFHYEDDKESNTLSIEAKQ